MRRTFAIAMLITSSAAAHDPVNQHTGWFVKQYNKQGAMCCTGHDAYYLEPDEWKIEKQKYRILLNGQWVEVDDSKVRSPVGGPNPTGRAIVWYDVNEYGIAVRCFTTGHEF